MRASAEGGGDNLCWDARGVSVCTYGNVQIGCGYRNLRTNPQGAKILRGYGNREEVRRIVYALSIMWHLDVQE